MPDRDAVILSKKCFQLGRLFTCPRALRASSFGEPDPGEDFLFELGAGNVDSVVFAASEIAAEAVNPVNLYMMEMSYRVGIDAVDASGIACDLDE